jgi:hypothetical protein
LPTPEPPQDCLLYHEFFNDGVADDFVPLEPDLWQVVNGEYEGDASDWQHHISVVDGFTMLDGSIEFDVKLAEAHATPGSYDFGLVVRYQSPAEYITLWIIPDYTGSHNIKLKRADDTNICSEWLPMAVNSGQWYHLKLTVTGDTYQGFIDGQPIFTCYDSSITQPGLVGLQFYNSRTLFDNFVVTSADGPCTPTPSPSPTFSPSPTASPSPSPTMTFTPSPTATITPTPWEPLPTPEPPQDCLLYHEFFNDGVADDFVPLEPDLWQVVNGEYEGDASDWQHHISVVDGFTMLDGSIEFDVKLAEAHATPGSYDFGLVVRYQSPAEYITLWIIPDYTGSHNIKLKRADDTNICSEWLPMAVNSGQWYHLKLTVTGDTYQGFIDGQPIFTCYDSSITQPGLVGVQFYNSRTLFDNFVVTSADGPCTPTPSPSPTFSPSPTASPSPSPTLTSTPSPSPTETLTPTPTPTETVSPTPTSSPSPGPSPTDYIEAGDVEGCLTIDLPVRLHNESVPVQDLQFDIYFDPSVLDYSVGD